MIFFFYISNRGLCRKTNCIKSFVYNTFSLFLYQNKAFLLLGDNRNDSAELSFQKAVIENASGVWGSTRRQFESFCCVTACCFDYYNSLQD